VTKMLGLLGALLLAASMTQAAYAGGSARVVYSWTYTDLGQGVWGGGALFADGSVGGNLPFSADNGQLIFQLKPTTWSEPIPGLIDLCFDVREMRGSSGYPASFCTADLGMLVPVTGTPTKIENPFAPGTYTLIRITPAN
jgi:hypothetical protein